MLADCCMLLRREWGLVAAVGWWQPPWLIDARNCIEQNTSPSDPFRLLHLHRHHASSRHGVPNRGCKEATNLVWRLPRWRRGSQPPWSVGACSLANLPSKNTLTTTQQRLSTRCDLIGQQRLPWCPTPGTTAYYSQPACWLIVACGSTRSGAPWRLWADDGHHGWWGTV